MTYNEFFDVWHDENDYIICRTSGSTGIPKQINLSKNLMRSSAKRTIDFFRLDSSSNLYSCISPDFIGGKMMAVRADLLGASFSYEKPTNSPLRNYSGERIDLLALVPSQLLYLLEHRTNLPDIRNIIIGGAPIPDSLVRKIADAGINAFETYGMTETASHVALRKISYPSKPFKLLPGIQISIDPDNRLAIKRPFDILTNDIVEFISDDEFYVLGRYDNVINSGGIKIFPEQIENILESELHHQCLITSEPDEKWGEIVIMIINDIKNPISNEIIFTKCKELLPKYSLPKKIIHSEIEMTSNGKKKRRISHFSQ